MQNYRFIDLLRRFLLYKTHYHTVLFYIVWLHTIYYIREVVKRKSNNCDNQLCLGNLFFQLENRKRRA